MAKHSTRDYLAPHSQAKADLISRYVSVYLNILERVKHVREVHVLDLLCGEGTYSDGRKGTAVQIVEAVADHHYANQGSKNRVRIVLNDLGRSDVEPGRTKIERVKEACRPAERRLPTHISVKYEAVDAVELAQRELSAHKPRRSLRRLFILDQPGYSQVELPSVLDLMSYVGTEVLFFLPVTHVYRFKTKEEPPPSLLRFTQALWGTDVFPGRPETFREDLKFRVDALMGEGVYTTPVILEKDPNHVHLLLHFTQNLLGLEQMVDRLWELDPELGAGYRVGGEQFEAFGPLDRFSKPLLDYVSVEGGRTNEEIAVFTLTNRFRTTHATQILSEAYRNGSIQRVAPDGSKARGFYLSKGGFRQNAVRVLPA